jgi:hypothetical protein
MGAKAEAELEQGLVEAGHGGVHKHLGIGQLLRRQPRRS